MRHSYFSEFMETVAFFVTLALMFLLVSGCTISFQNISTHGTATDLVDQDQGATADVKTDLEIPLNKMGV